MYRRTPTGDYLVGVCTNTLCAVMGGDAILEVLEDHLGVHAGETTDDGKVTLEHVECNAACDYAPVVMVNWEFFDNQTPSSARELVDQLRDGRAGVAHPRCAAVHVPRDRPHPGRLPRSAARRQRRRARRGDAGRTTGGPRAGHDGARRRRCRCSRPMDPTTSESRRSRSATSPHPPRRPTSRRRTGSRHEPHPRAQRLLGRPESWTLRDLPRPRRLPGAVDGPGDGPRRRHRPRQGLGPAGSRRGGLPHRAEVVVHPAG